ncbi:MAG TPA: protein kinase [Phycisphaerae bacterium]|nr:protein kinase [Phycisphaerae bacterium]
MQQYKTGDEIGGEYTVLNVFGGANQSGMGVVYLVQDWEIPRPIVLKTFQGAGDEGTRCRFISEANAWISAGAHANLVQAYWVREIGGQLFIAAEYIEPDEDGRNNLSHFLTASQLCPEVVLLWATQFCYGMDYAKSKGVVAHRDIKPDNLMIDKAMTLKVTDFGLAKSINTNAVSDKRRWWIFAKKREASPLARTIKGVAMGTTPFMAPEQFTNARNVDHRADIYSFGIVLYQMASGNRYPYRINQQAADVTAEFFRAHSQQKPVPLESPLMPIVARCLAKDPNRRYASYNELLDNLSTVAKKLKTKLVKQTQVAKEDEELYAQAQSYVALGNKDRALDAICKYVSQYPENACGWTEKGRLHIERGEYQDAIIATRKSLELNPYNTHSWNNLGILLNRMSAPIDEIRKAYATALVLDPENTAAMMNLVGPLVLGKQFTEAAALTAKAIRLRPSKPLVLEKAEALLREVLNEKNFAAAETLLSSWTKARPSDANAWHNFGLIALSKGDIDQAIQCFVRVLDLVPNDNFAIAQLAKLRSPGNSDSHPL